MGGRSSPVRGRFARQVLFACVLGVLTSHGLVAQSGTRDTPFVETGHKAWSLDDWGFRSAYRDAQTKREAAARLARFPESVNTVAWLAHAGRLGDALDVLQRVIERHPARIGDGVEALDPLIVELQRDQESEHQKRLTTLLAAARATLPGLDRESAARLEMRLIRLDSLRSYTLRELPETYRGTLAARLAAVDRVRSGENVSSELAEYDAIALREGTNEVAAKARYAKATTLLTRFDAVARETGNPDPTETWLEVLTIVRDLESGRYAPGPWVDDAVTRVASFSLRQKRVSPDNAVRLLEALRLFVVEHQTMLGDSSNDPVTGLVISTMPALAAFLPDGVAVMDRMFTVLAGELRDPAAALYLRARWLDQVPVGTQPMALPPRSPTHEADVRALMASAAAAARDSVHARHALARLADRESRDPASLESARAHFEEYLRRFGSAPDAALVALRLGHVEHAQGRHQAAVTRFAGVARANPGEPMLRALASAYAARASEDAGRFDDALGHYRQANTAWTPDVPETLRVLLPSPPPSAIEDALLERNRGEVSRIEVQTRLRELTRSLSARGGAELERGRWLLRQSRPREAIPALEGVVREQARTPLGAEARRILTMARIDAALVVSDVSSPDVDRAAALAELDALATQQPFDASIGIAGVLAATLSKLQGRDADADARMAQSLRQWATASARVQTAPKQGSLESDVLAVRDAVAAGWHNASPPATPRPFVVASSDLRVQLMESATWTSFDVSRQPPGVSNVVFMTEEEMTYLTRAVSRIGGTRRRQPGFIMEVPNQPMGDAQTIIRWWNGFFAARPGHWAGFDIMTSPAFSVLRFTNAERTRAIVPVTNGYSGGDVVLNKVNGVWTVTDFANNWIE